MVLGKKEAKIKVCYIPFESPYRLPPPPFTHQFSVQKNEWEGEVEGGGHVTMNNLTYGYSYLEIQYQ